MQIPAHPSAPPLQMQEATAFYDDSKLSALINVSGGSRAPPRLRARRVQEGCWRSVHVLVCGCLLIERIAHVWPRSAIRAVATVLNWSS